VHKVKEDLIYLFLFILFYSITSQCWTWKHMIIIKTYKSEKKYLTNFKKFAKR